MNEVVKLDARGSAPAQRTSVPSLDRFLEPERLLREHGRAISDALMPDQNGETVRNCSFRRDSLERALDRCLPAATLQATRDVLAAALSAGPDRKATALSVALLLDSRSRQPSNPGIYVDALVYDLTDEGFPPAVVVAACQRLRRTQVFAPEIAEVIAACREVQASYRAAWSLAGYAIEGRARAETALDELACLPAPPNAPAAPGTGEQP